MIVGIDLGTTHSLVGLYTGDGTVLANNALGERLTPSAVAVDEDGMILVGRAAADRLVVQPDAGVTSFKRWMGTDRVTRLGRHEVRPEELSAMVLRALVADAESQFGEKVEEAVISVPAYFGDAQRKATRIAGELAGIRVERLVNEPTAAALAYGLQQRERGGRFLVFDLGGGTFDVSILEMFEGVMEVHASSGDNFLGGDDFLAALTDCCMHELGITAGDLAPTERAQLQRRLERLKRDLSQAGGEARLHMDLAGRTLEWGIDEARFAQLCEPLVQRLRAPLERAMRDARLTPEKLDEIVLVGGASRMPLAARLVSRMFGKLPLRHINPDETIAMGAAVAAGMKARNQALEEVILTDVCPHTLGVSTCEELADGTLVHGVFSPIIQRNTTVPVSRVRRYQPLRDYQQEVNFTIYQGESPRVEHNVRLGLISVKVPRLKSAENPVDIRFTYDINGLLQVEALVLSTGDTQEVILEQNPGVLDPEQVRERLAALAGLKVHPRDQQENVALLTRAERLYAEVLWARQDVQQALLHFRQVLESQEPDLIREHRASFQEMLDRIEAQV